MMWEDAALETDFRYVEVTPDGEGREIGGITGGKITRNYLSALKEAAEIAYTDVSQLEGVRALRVYLLAGDTETALGTFLVSTPKRAVRDTHTSGTATCYSMLQILDGEGLDESLMIPAGTNAIAYAETLITSRGLEVTATPSDKALPEDAVFGTDKNVLDVVVWLCQLAGYGTPLIDGYGRIILQPYIEPSEVQPSRTYGKDSRVMFPDMDYELDDFSVPNKVIVVSSSDDACVIGTAVNQSGNRFSVDERGRIVTATYEVDGLETQEEAGARARRMLSEQTAVESVDISHLYDGSNIQDVVAVDYGGVAVGSLSVANQEISLSLGCPVKDHARRFVDV